MNSVITILNSNNMIRSNGVVLIHISLYMNEAEIYGSILIEFFKFLSDCAPWTFIIFGNINSNGGCSKGRTLQLPLTICRYQG